MRKHIKIVGLFLLTLGVVTSVALLNAQEVPADYQEVLKTVANLGTISRTYSK